MARPRRQPDELVSDDDASAAIPDVYETLRAAARRHFGRQPPGHTLQPTALVHEAFIKLASHENVTWENRAHFLALASRVMRQILIDIARAKSTGKRGGAWSRISIDDAEHGRGGLSIDLIELGDALDELEQLNQTQARIVELHFLGGMKFEEIAQLLDLPLRDARNEWYMARAWLRGRIGGDESHG